MNKFNTALLAVVTAITLAACAPAADNAKTTADDAKQVQILSLPEGLTTWSATVNGMPVTYHVVDQIMSASGSPLQGTISGTPENLFSPEPAFCQMQITQGFLEPNLLLSSERQRGRQVNDLAVMLAQCLRFLQLDAGTNGFDQAELYMDAWAKLYWKQCGSRAQPLGWPSEDGECEVPAATDPRPGT